MAKISELPLSTTITGSELIEIVQEGISKKTLISTIPANKSAYQIALANGFTGNENEWLLSLTGPQGIQGPAGVTGIQGLTGAAGADGLIGPQGPVGLQGEVGLPGAQGPIGETGAAGADSVVPGPAGPPGETGPQGIQGPAGDGGTVVPTPIVLSADYEYNVNGKLVKVIETTDLGPRVTNTIYNSDDLPATVTIAMGTNINNSIYTYNLNKQLINCTFIESDVSQIWWNLIPSLTPVAIHDARNYVTGKLIDRVGNNNITLYNPVVSVSPNYEILITSSGYDSRIVYADDCVVAALVHAPAGPFNLFNDSVSGGYSIHQNSSTSWFSRAGSFGGDTPHGSTLSMWDTIVFVAIVKNINTHTFYVNGVAVGSAFSNSVLPPAFDQIGSNNQGLKVSALGYWTGTATATDLTTIESVMRSATTA